MKEGKYTIELFAKDRKLSRQSALNLLTKLKKQGYVKVSGGGRQKRIYTVSKLPKKQPNGFYSIVNKYSPLKLQPKFEHYVIGKYTIENAIIDGIKINDSRTLKATMYLFNHITNWKRLFDLAKKEHLTKKVIEVYKKTKKTIKCRRMPKRYLR